MRMTTLNVSLPETMRAFIEEQVASGGYGTASEYVRALVRDAQKREAEAQLEAKLLEALEQPAHELTPERWEDVRRRAREITRRKKRV